MHKVALDVSIFVDFLLGEETARRQADLLVFLHVADHKAGVLMISAHDLVQLDVVQLYLGTR